MHYDSFNERMLTKLKNIISVYSSRIFEPVLTVNEVEGFETKEHYRSVPERDYRLYRSGDRWGGEYGNIWIKMPFFVPKSVSGKQLYVCENTGARESLLFINGAPRGMFSTVSNSFDGLQNNVLLTACANPGEKFEIALECYAWHYETGLSAYENLGKDTADDEDFVKIFKNIQICTVNKPVRDFCINLRILLSLAENKHNAYLKAKATDMLEEVFGCVVLFPDIADEQEIMQGIVCANTIMEKIFEENKSGGVNGFAGIIGHSHMDTAWLWPMDETIRKCARTFSNALNLMEQYPDYKFIQSSVLHTYWMEKMYPSIFEDIKKRAKEGRYELNGAAWVECDCNITGGEFMIRQFLKGQNYLKEKFGITADSFWLPDTFGYSAAIPQIMKGCGVKYFYTTKLGWNEHNRFPFETFVWRGMDGSEVITHFNVTHCEPSPEKLFNHIDELQEKQADDSRLIAFGYGDGGGGPTDIMIGQASKIAKINGMPEVKYTTISEFGKRLEAKKNKLPVFSGELYLELHRGTLTQMHNIKRNNRLAETAIRNMELMAVITRAPFFAEKYDEFVKILLENQFHDILPGTSLKCVHDKSIETINTLIRDVEDETKRTASSALGGYTRAVTLFNPLSFERCDRIYIENPEGFIDGAKNQLTEDVFGRKLLAVSGIKLSGYEAKSFELTASSERGETPFSYDSRLLITPYAEIIFGEDGYIESFIDRASDRELRREGAAPLNSFYMGEDIAVFWDNWDIEYDQKFKMKKMSGFVSRKLISEGAVELRLRSVFKLGKSELTQDMVVYADSPRVDFHTKLDWQDKHRLLKVSFDLDILSTTAKHEIQFGHIDRPTTENDRFETAKFEVCNHKWTDISESRFGVAMLNDCKYGISVRASDVRLTLHRGGCRPDYSGDVGIHEMTYSIMPHACGFDTDSVIKPAYELNTPICAFNGELTKELFAPVKITAENIICESVKPAENDEKSYVLRLYEAERNKTGTTLIFPEDVKKVYIADMLEQPIEEFDITNGYIDLTFKPFEIKTILCER